MTASLAFIVATCAAGIAGALAVSTDDRRTRASAVSVAMISALWAIWFALKTSHGG